MMLFKNNKPAKKKKKKKKDFLFTTKLHYALEFQEDHIPSGIIDIFKDTVTTASWG